MARNGRLVCVGITGWLPSELPAALPRNAHGNKLSHRVWDSYDAILAACKDAWNTLIDDTPRVRSITHRCWATVNI